MNYYYDKYLEFVHNFEELSEKFKSLPPNSPHRAEKIKKFFLINQQIDHMNQEIEDFIVDIDQEKFKITKDEQQRIEDTMNIDRAIDRIKPLMVLSMLSESMTQPPNNQFHNNQFHNNQFHNNQFHNSNLDHTVTPIFETTISYPQFNPSLE